MKDPRTIKRGKRRRRNFFTRYSIFLWSQSLLVSVTDNLIAKSYMIRELLEASRQALIYRKQTLGIHFFFRFFLLFIRQQLEASSYLFIPTTCSVHGLQKRKTNEEQHLALQWARSLKQV